MNAKAISVKTLSSPTRPPLKPPLSSSELLAWLKSPAPYPERPARVECVETHISWVFLGSRTVYKLKKPVRFDFLDFSTPELRRLACEAEVRLNRRLAPGVYLGVVPITLEVGGRLALGGRGLAIDWLVKMRRLPADGMLDERIRAGQLTVGDIDSLAAYLVRFYQRASPLTLHALDYRRTIEKHVRANRRELLDPAHALPAALVKRAHAGQLRFMQLESAQIEGRVCDGRIIDGHGDLRPEHVCLEAEPAIFDCVEFSDEFRRIDVVDELSFLAMECDFLGAEAVGKKILDFYCKQSQDRASDGLVNFYKSYRACVRAKVAALTADQANPQLRAAALGRAEAYLRLAGSCAERLGPPSAIVVTGLMGSGKSTLAESLAELTGAELLQTDLIRRELLGASPTAAGFNEAAYRQESRDKVYDEMFARADKLLEQGVSVILDGTFLAARHRRRAADGASQRGAAALMLRCVCSEDVALRRISQRAAKGTAPSEARPELLRLQRAEFEPDPPDLPAFSIDATETLRVQECAALDRLREVLSHTVRR